MRFYCTYFILVLKSLYIYIFVYIIEEISFRKKIVFSWFIEQVFFIGYMVLNGKMIMMDVEGSTHGLIFNKFIIKVVIWGATNLVLQCIV